MKKTILTLIAALITVSGIAQTPTNLFVKGNIDIKYNTRQNPVGTKGIQDVYTLNVNVANSALFHGTILDNPQIIEGMFSKTITQPRSLKYDIACDVINPKNISQTKNVGKMYGNVPISSDGTYQYDNGSLTVDVLPIGNAGGFSSKFSGIAVGKPLGAKPANWLDTLKCQAVSITRSVNGKTSTVVLKKYDKFECRNLVIGAGPVAMYQNVTLSGQFLYDYDKSCWFANNVTLQYAENNIMKIDRLTGTIRWVESEKRAQDGMGEYQLDLRVNESPANVSDAFSTTPSDESSFFETDENIAGVSGTMKYRDVLRGDTTLSSQVAIDWTANKITKQELMAITKVIIFAAVVPMNSD